MQHYELKKLLSNSNFEELIKANLNTYQINQKVVSTLNPDFKFCYNSIINFTRKILGYTWDSSEKRWINNKTSIEKIY